VSTRRPPFLRIAIVWVVLELIAAAQVREGGQRVLTTWLTAPVRPVRHAALTLATAAGDARDGIADIAELVTSNRRLRAERDQALARLHLLRNDLRVLQAANQNVLALSTLAEDAVAARCLYRDLSRGLLEISAGATAGLRPSLPVLAAGGVVGRVLRVHKVTSWVQLTTHPSAAVAVQTPDGHAEGLASGLGNGRLQLEYIPQRFPLERNAQLRTTGNEGIFPSGLPVATVESVTDLGEPFLTITAVPAVELGTLEVVLVVRSWPVSEADR
jgi:rod shape-determining protein MreC